MSKEKLKQLNEIFIKYPEIKLVYLFGSQATGKTGSMSDYDFAVYFDEQNKIKMFDLKFKIQDEISRCLKTDKVDLVVLDATESPELKYNVIKDGKLIYEQEPYRVVVEPQILNEYFDFQYWVNKCSKSRLTECQI